MDFAPKYKRKLGPFVTTHIKLGQVSDILYEDVDTEDIIECQLKAKIRLDLNMIFQIFAICCDFVENQDFFFHFDQECLHTRHLIVHPISKTLGTLHVM